jgi:hypothetical protein
MMGAETESGGTDTERGEQRQKLVEQESRQEEWSGGRLERAEITSGAETDLGSSDRVIRAGAEIE